MSYKYIYFKIKKCNYREELKLEMQLWLTKMNYREMKYITNTNI